MKTPVTVLCAMAVLLAAGITCNKYGSFNSHNTAPSNSSRIPPDVTVRASLSGRVLDENGLPVQGAAVTSGKASTTTDVNGVFHFSDMSMSSRFGYVKVMKGGYYTGSRSIITNLSVVNYVTIQLIPRTETGSFAASAGGAILIKSGDTAVFAAASMVQANGGSVYSGTVHVFGRYLDPTDANLYKYMPGDLRGIDSSGNETALESFGMLLVELQDDAGHKLQLAPGQKATLTWTIPDSLQGAAPASIPLWYFNDSSGRWIQQGAAIRRGKSYVGRVGHLSYWNGDAAANTVNFKLRVKDQYGNPVAYACVLFQSPAWGTRGSYTDSTGFTQGLIPKGKPVMIKVVAECGNILGGINVGPAITDVNPGTDIIHVPQTELTLMGTVVDCNKNPVDSGYVNVHVDGLDYRGVVEYGAFTLPIHRCYSMNAPITLTASDLTSKQTGARTMVNATIGKVDVGRLSACAKP